MESLANELTREVNNIKTQYSLINVARSTGGKVSLSKGDPSITFATEEELKAIKKRYEEKSHIELKKYKLNLRRS